MGDLLQSSPLITYLREKYPGVEIGMLASAGFKEVVAGIPGIDRSHPLELIKYMSALGKNEVIPNYTLFKDLLEELRAYRYELVFNLTHNRMGAALSKLISDNVVGLKMDPEGMQSVENPWMAQFYNTNIVRGLNQFNLVDLYRLSAGFQPHEKTELNSRLRFHVPPDDIQWAEEILKNRGWDGNSSLIGIQAGASADSKRWPEEYYNSAAKILSSKYTIVFFGDSSEKELVSIASSGVGNSIDLCGATSVGLLAAVLKKCSLLISNDTGTQHLAAAVKTPVLSLTIGPALASETGPFGENHIVIEPDVECMPCSYTYKCPHLECRHIIKPELTIFLAEKMFARQAIDNIPPALTANVRIARTCFDENGLWDLSPIVPTQFQLKQSVNIAYRKTWFTINNSLNINDIKFPNGNGKIVALDIQELLRTTERLSGLAEKGISLSENLAAASQNPTANIDSIKRLGFDIAALDRELDTIAKSEPSLRPLIIDFNLGKEALPQADLKTLAGNTARLYRKLFCASKLFAAALLDCGVTVEWPSPALKIKSGVKVLAIDAPYFVTGEMVKALRRCGSNVEIAALTNEIKKNPRAAEIFIENILALSNKFRPDFILSVNHLGFDGEGYLLKRLEQMQIKSAVYYVDSPLFILDEPARLASDASTLFIWDDYYIPRLHQAGFANVEYLPLGTDETIFHPRPRSEIPPDYQTDICYAADSLEERSAEHSRFLTDSMNSPNVYLYIKERMRAGNHPVPEILEEVAEQFDFDSPLQRRHFLAAWVMKIHQPLRLEIIKAISTGLTIFGGEDWARFLKGTGASLKGRLRYFDQLPLVYSGCQIGFNSTSPQMPNGVNQRVFDLPSAGGFLLSDYRAALEGIFDIKSDIAVYYSPQEAKELADFYLKNPSIRLKMSELARSKILSAHTYVHRAAAIIKKMQSN